MVSVISICLFCELAACKQEQLLCNTARNKKIQENEHVYLHFITYDFYIDPMMDYYDDALAMPCFLLLML